MTNPITPVLTDMSALEQLKYCRNIISDEKNWIRGRYFLIFTGDNGEQAAKYCSMGVLYSHFRNSYEAENYLMSAALEVFNTTPIHVNDSMKHEDVMKMWDRAIELAEIADNKELITEANSTQLTTTA